MKSKISTGIAALILALIGAGSAQAQEEVSPGVARISFIHGDVSTQRGDSGDWSAAALNAPLVNGDKVSTGNRSRAEVQLDYADIMRLADDTQISLATVTRTQIQIQVAQGLVNYSVFKGSEADTEIDTPNVAIRPSRGDGSYRIVVNPGGETQVVVRKGEADISTPQGSTRVTQGQLITVQGTGDSVQYKVSEAPSKDDFDSWNKDRDNRIRSAESWRHTDRYYTGSEDLDAYGHWTNVPDYGQVWVPAAAPGWAPYRDGQWVWEPYYGWTWVSYEPWGWAPYHYGRWFLYGGGWAWWPGPVYAYPAYYPVWSPAYVSFFGFGYGGGGWHFGFGVGFGSIGWFPIGPCDRFYPWWGGYRNHFNVVNITNITNITNIKNVTNINNGVAPLHAGNRFSNLQQLQTNERLRQAVSTVPSEKFGAGHVQPVAATSSMLHDGHLMTGNLPVVPTHASLSASGRPASATTLQARQSQNFFSKRQPATAPRPFNEQAGQIQQAIQRDGHFAPVNGDAHLNAANTGKASTPMSQNGAAAKVTPPSFFKNGDVNPRQRAATVESPSGAAKTNTPQAQTTNGWHRFGSNPPAQATQGQGSAKPSAPTQTQNQPANRQPMKPFAPPNAATNSSSGRSNGSGGQPAANGPARSNGNWQRFSGPSSTNPNPSNSGRPSSAQTIPSRSPASNPSTQSNGSWQHFTPPARTESPRSSYRPPLDMHRPIITPRESSPYSGGSYRGNSGGGGTYRSAPQPNGGYRGPSGGGYRAPSAPSGGGYRAPSAPSGGGYRAPSAPSSGGYRGSPSGGGGGSRGGNGGDGHSAPPHSSGSSPRH